MNQQSCVLDAQSQLQLSPLPVPPTPSTPTPAVLPVQTPNTPIPSKSKKITNKEDNTITNPSVQTNNSNNNNNNIPASNQRSTQHQLTVAQLLSQKHQQLEPKEEKQKENNSHKTLKRSDSENLDVPNGKKKVHLTTTNNNNNNDTGTENAQINLSKTSNDSFINRETTEESNMSMCTNYVIQENKQIQSADVFHQNNLVCNSNLQQIVKPIGNNITHSESSLSNQITPVFDPNQSINLPQNNLFTSNESVLLNEINPVSQVISMQLDSTTEMNNHLLNTQNITYFPEACIKNDEKISDFNEEYDSSNNDKLKKDINSKSFFAEKIIKNESISCLNKKPIYLSLPVLHSNDYIDFGMKMNSKMLSKSYEKINDLKENTNQQYKKYEKAKENFKIWYNSVKNTIRSKLKNNSILVNKKDTANDNKLECHGYHKAMVECQSCGFFCHEDCIYTYETNKYCSICFKHKSNKDSSNDE